MLYIAIISYIPQIHQTALQLTRPKKMDGKRYHCNYFSVFFGGQRKYNPLDYFRMGIIREDKILFLRRGRPYQ